MEENSSSNNPITPFNNQSPQMKPTNNSANSDKVEVPQK